MPAQHQLVYGQPVPLMRNGLEQFIVAYVNVLIGVHSAYYYVMLQRARCVRACVRPLTAWLLAIVFDGPRRLVAPAASAGLRCRATSHLV